MSETVLMGQIWMGDGEANRESREEQLTFVGEDDIEIEMRIPQEAVKLIIGRQGANIKQLRKHTGARIDMDTMNVGNVRVLLISGFPVQP
ncbi:tudor and KH domain-containing protein [Cricetulus griseus]|nr:tudor and KH domain-containing protein [Cricetulus griseus]